MEWPSIHLAKRALFLLDKPGENEQWHMHNVAEALKLWSVVPVAGFYRQGT